MQTRNRKEYKPQVIDRFVPCLAIYAREKRGFSLKFGVFEVDESGLHKKGFAVALYVPNGA